MGMRLSGIEGVVVHTSEEVSNALDKAMEMKDVGVVLMTELAVKQCREKVYDYKLTRETPLIVEIPAAMLHRGYLIPFPTISQKQWE